MTFYRHQSLFAFIESQIITLTSQYIAIYGNIKNTTFDWLRIIYVIKCIAIRYLDMKLQIKRRA